MLIVHLTRREDAALLSLRVMAVKVYLACTDELETKIKSSNEVSATFFGWRGEFIPLGRSQEQAVELLFASKQGPHEAANTGGTIVHMLVLEMSERDFNELVDAKVMKKNPNYTGGAWRWKVSSVPLGETVDFTWYDLLLPEPLGLERWAMWALKFKVILCGGECETCGGPVAAVWRNNNSSPWYCASCWNQHFVDQEKK